MKKVKLVQYSDDGLEIEHRYALIGKAGAVEFHYAISYRGDRLFEYSDIIQKTRGLKASGVEVHSHTPRNGVPKPSKGHCPFVEPPCYCSGYGLAAVSLLEMCAYHHEDKVDERYIWPYLQETYESEFNTEE